MCKLEKAQSKQELQYHRLKQKQKEDTGPMHSSKHIWQEWKSNISKLKQKEPHDERMSECKAELKHASQREKFLLNELSACRTEMQSMETNFQYRHASEMTRLRTTLIEEGEAYKNEALDYLGREFKSVLAKTESSMNENFAIEVAEMSEQNDRLQTNWPLPKDHFAWKARLEAVVKVTKPLLGSRPHLKSQRLSRKLLSRIRLRFLRACVICFRIANLKPSIPPGFEGTPKNQNEKTSGVPPAETNTQSELNAAMLLQAAANLSNKSETEEGKPKVKRSGNHKAPRLPKPRDLPLLADISPRNHSRGERSTR